MFGYHKSKLMCFRCNNCETINTVLHHTNINKIWFNCVRCGKDNIKETVRQDNGI